MTTYDGSDGKLQTSFNEELVQKSRYHLNLDQDVIVTTEDKLRLCFITYLADVSRREKWIAPVSLFFTIILVLASSKFHDNFFLPGSTWQAVFIISLFASAIWLIVSIIQAFQAKQQLDDLINEIKKVSKDVK